MNIDAEKNAQIIRSAILNSTLGRVAIELTGSNKKIEEEEAFLVYWQREIEELLKGHKLAEELLGDRVYLLEKVDFQHFTDTHLISEFITRKTILQDVFKIPKESLLAIYEIAQRQFAEKNYDEAHALFSFLIALNHRIYSFWIGKAMANELRQQWSKALGDLWMAQSLDSQRPEAYVGLIRIYKGLKDKDQLNRCFEIIDHIPGLKALILGQATPTPAALSKKSRF